MDKHFEDERTTRLSDNSTNIDETAEREKNKEQNDLTKRFGDDIWAITRGLPLAVVLLSGLLKTREYPNEWEAVFKHLKSKQSKRLGTLLTTCFDDLPQDLKSCFLYFAAFPMNTPIEARKLVRLWMAEGFLRPRDGNTMENVGRIYLNELNSRNLVQFVKLDNINGDDELAVSVHHEVHHFVQLEAQEANFVDIHNGYDIPYLTSARRLSLQNYTNKYAALANSMPKLRSILSNFIEEDEEDTRGSVQEMNIEVDGEEDDSIENVTDGLRKLKDPDDGNISIKQQGKQNEISEQAKRDVKQSKKPWLGPWSGLLSYWGNGKKRQDYIKSYISETLQVSKFLRVVKLQGIEFGEKLPATIGNAVHLQYLGVTGCSLKWIPSAVGKLKHLQTLDVQDTYVQELPQAFWRIRALRHVSGTSIYLPKRVGNLKHLHTLVKVLPIPNPNHNCWDSKTFERMLRLQSLNIVDSSKDAENLNELFAAIEKPNILEYLQTLVLQANKFPMCIFTSSSQRRLRALELYGKLDVTMLSSEKGKEETNICLPNLTTLSLEDTEVTQDFMNYLANFPLLANLTLKQNSYKDAKCKLVFNSGGYKCLTKMTLCDLEDLEVQIMKSGLTVLTDLVISQSTQTQLTQVKLVVYGKHEFLKTLQHEKIELHAEAP
ncbi:putative disease resistance RPP13-like protein 3 [Miscanthus floridulus]|uniref:putative disease resistance RPP13-like protein 3 n=1 Tax=Miscanthus floridulus TaxID=154761 RepID=UPI003458F18D